MWRQHCGSVAAMAILDTLAASVLSFWRIERQVMKRFKNHYNLYLLDRYKNHKELKERENRKVFSLFWFKFLEGGKENALNCMLNIRRSIHNCYSNSFRVTRRKNNDATNNAVYRSCAVLSCIDASCREVKEMKGLSKNERAVINLLESHQGIYPRWELSELDQRYISQLIKKGYVSLFYFSSRNSEKRMEELVKKIAKNFTLINLYEPLEFAALNQKFTTYLILNN